MWPPPSQFTLSIPLLAPVNPPPPTKFTPSLPHCPCPTIPPPPPHSLSPHHMETLGLGSLGGGSFITAVDVDISLIPCCAAGISEGPAAAAPMGCSSSGHSKVASSESNMHSSILQSNSSSKAERKWVMTFLMGVAF